ncbi:MAG: hypothetical protein U9O18_06085 [Chloroflexota bacterium]|nr:hypothetical protein [Chloroflexota bacterium]
MARTPRPAQGHRQARWITRTGAILGLAGALSLALPTIATLAPDAPFPSPVALAADENVRLDKPSVPVRVRVPYAGVDLPVVSSQKTVPGNNGSYPLCDVAQYWTRYDLPGAPGTTWIYAHAQAGMFLPLFTISERTNGNGLLGKIVEVQTKDGRLLRYRITEVKERAYNRKIAQQARPSQHRLILQTSTGPPGTVPKLQVAARLVGAQKATEPAPKAQPRACWQPRPTKTSGANGKTRENGKKPKATPVPEVTTDPDEPLDAMTLLFGSGAVLLGTTVVVIYLVRRP